MLKIYNDPYKDLNELTNVQNFIKNKLNENKIPSKLAIEAHTGTGKTLAGLYFIFHYKQPSIIVSTRCIVNDQWYILYKKLNPEHKILIEDNFTKKNLNTADLMIITHIRLKNLIENYKDIMLNRFKILIFDEMHNLATKTNEKLFLNYIHDSFKILALSATFPSYLLDKKRFKRINLLFNNIYRIKSDKIVDDIPVNLIEVKKIPIDKILDQMYRLFLTPGKILLTTRLIKSSLFKIIYICDWYQNTFNDTTTCIPLNILLLRSSTTKSYFINIQQLYINNLLEEFKDLINKIVFESQKELNSNHKYKDISSKIELLKRQQKQYNDITILAYLDNLLNQYKDELEEISFNSKSNVLDNTIYKYFHQHESISNHIIFIKKDFQPFLISSNIIVSTNSRLQEGFNCEELVFGLFYDFPFSYSNRIQLLGRIRRMQSNIYSTFISSLPRLAICKINTTPKMMYINKIKYLQQYYPDLINNYINNFPIYDYAEEDKLFKENNYIKINNMRSFQDPKYYNITKPINNILLQYHEKSTIYLNLNL